MTFHAQNFLKNILFCLPLKNNRFFHKSDLQQRKMKNCEVNNAAELISEASQIF